MFDRFGSVTRRTVVLDCDFGQDRYWCGRTAELQLEIERCDRGRNETIDIAVKAFELSQNLRSKWFAADYAAKRRILRAKVSMVRGWPEQQLNQLLCRAGQELFHQLFEQLRGGKTTPGKFEHALEHATREWPIWCARPAREIVVREAALSGMENSNQQPLKSVRNHSRRQWLK